MFTILTLFILIKVSLARNPCENIIDNYELYHKKKSQKNDFVCWTNIFNTLNDNSNYKYDNICIYAFEKHICHMILYNNENYETLPKKWCSHEYKIARDTYEKKCTLGYFK